MTITYEYPVGGHYSQTVATIDGRKYTVNTQYCSVMPHGEHADDCDQITKMGGRCSCGMLDGIDVDALVADARVNGRFWMGQAPVFAPATETAASPMADLVCPKCGTVCYGDCAF